MDPIKVEIDPNAPLAQRYVGSSEDGPIYQEMSLVDAIIEAGAQRVIASDDELKTKVGEKLDEILDTVLAERLPPIIEKALADPVTVTDNWGKTVVQDTTVEDLIVERAREQLVLQEDRGYSMQAKTVLTTVVDNVVDRRLEAELSKRLKEMRELLLAKVSKVAGEQIAAEVGAIMSERKGSA